MTAEISSRPILSLKGLPAACQGDGPVHAGPTVTSDARKDRPRKSSRRRKDPHAWDVALLDDLVAEWPGVFFPRGVAPLPLAVGIHGEILAKGDALRQRLGLSMREFRTQVWVSLRHYSGAKRYQQALACGGFRIDLSGEMGEEVSAQHRADALTRLNAMLLAAKDKAKPKRKVSHKSG